MASSKARYLQQEAMRVKREKEYALGPNIKRCGLRTLARKQLFLQQRISSIESAS